MLRRKHGVHRFNLAPNVELLRDLLGSMSHVATGQREYKCSDFLDFATCSLFVCYFHLLVRKPRLFNAQFLAILPKIIDIAI